MIRREVAINAARAAASIIRDGFARLRGIDVQHKAPGDWVTETDRAAEEKICALIWAAFPSDAILGEESGARAGPASPASGYQWIVDPLDGTYNFAHGNPHVCTSIACLDPSGDTILAVVQDPFRVEIFHAEKGRGAFSGDVPLQVNQRRELTQALVASGLPSAKHASFALAWPAFEALVQTCGQVRRTGSAVLDLAYVAAGRLDASVVLNLRKWDIAAGAMLVQEAGGVCVDAQGGDAFLEKEQVIAGNAHLVPALVHVLKSRA